MLKKLVIIVVLLCGCGSTNDLLLERLPLPVVQGEPQIEPRPILSDEQRETLQEELAVQKALLSILNETKEELAEKLDKADKFSFVLSDEERTQVKAGKLLLEYINEAMAKTRSRISEIERTLG